MKWLIMLHQSPEFKNQNSGNQPRVHFQKEAATLSLYKEGGCPGNSIW